MAPISTPSQPSLDYSLPTQVESTEAVSSGQANEPQNLDRIENSQAANRTPSGAESDTDPGGLTASLAAQPDNTDGIDAGSLANDARQADASAEEQRGKAAQDLTKAANEKEGLSKAGADPPLAQQLAPPGRAEVGSAFAATTEASRSRGQAGSAGVSGTSQVYAGGLVSSARFTQQAGNAEMQVRLRSEELGPIAVHTIARGSDIGASIRVEARDTQVLLANELSQLERALNERNLRVERLDVLQGFAAGGQSDGTASGNYHGNPAESRQRFSSYFSGQTYTALPEAPTVSEDWGLGLSSNRINLRV
jgi:flagellar hook-length control protein FliK